MQIKRLAFGAVASLLLALAPIVSAAGNTLTL